MSQPARYLKPPLVSVYELHILYASQGTQNTIENQFTNTQALYLYLSTLCSFFFHRLILRFKSVLSRLHIHRLDLEYF